MKCPKCNYERQPVEPVPDGECPACGIIYAKYRGFSPDGATTWAKPSDVPENTDAFEHSVTDHRVIEVLDEETAGKDIKIAYTVAFVLAGFQALILLLMSFFSVGVAPAFLDVLVLAAFGLLLKTKKSRTGAILFLIYAVIIVYVTFAARAGLPASPPGGKNIFLAIGLLYGAFMGVRGTFRFHRFVGTGMQVACFLKNTALIAGYVIVATLIYFVVTAFPAIQALFAAMPVGTLEMVWLVLMTGLIFLGLFEILPWMCCRRAAQTDDQTDDQAHKVI